MKKNAVLDKTKKYRYVLSRQWGPSNNFVNFILFNPSTADQNKDDQTVRRCINLTKSWQKYDGCYITNLFAFRTRHPKILKKSKDPVGTENNKYLKKLVDQSKIVVIAWGIHGNFRNRDKEVLRLIGQKGLYCLEKTKFGHPKHPLTIRRNTKPMRYTVS